MKITVVHKAFEDTQIIVAEVTAPAVFVGPLLPYTVPTVNVKSLPGVAPPIKSPATLNVSLPAYPVPHFIIVAVALEPPD